MNHATQHVAERKTCITEQDFWTYIYFEIRIIRFTNALFITPQLEEFIIWLRIQFLPCTSFGLSFDNSSN